MPPMLWPTRTAGSGSAASASQIRRAYASSVTSGTGVGSSPAPGRSSVATAWPRPASSLTKGSQHQAPWNAPWTRTNRAMGATLARAGRRRERRRPRRHVDDLGLAREHLVEQHAVDLVVGVGAGVAQHGEAVVEVGR